MFIVVEALEHVKPTTVPPVPEEVRPVIVLLAKVSVLAPVAELLIEIPVIEDVPVILEIVLLERELVVPKPQ
jgi:hypothetical protein